MPQALPAGSLRWYNDELAKLEQARAAAEARVATYEGEPDHLAILRVGLARRTRMLEHFRASWVLPQGGTPGVATQARETPMANDSKMIIHPKPAAAPVPAPRAPRAEDIERLRQAVVSGGTPRSRVEPLLLVIETLQTQIADFSFQRQRVEQLIENEKANAAALAENLTFDREQYVAKITRSYRERIDRLNARINDMQGQQAEAFNIAKAYVPAF